jgi:polyisoprenoid-binding protein YceI
MKIAGWKRWALIGVAALLVVLVGGPFVFFHFIEGKPPAPLALTTVTTAPAGSPSTSTASASSPATSGSLTGAWNVSSGSAGYRVKETLFGQSHTAVGRGTGVTGKFTIAGSKVTEGSFSVDMTTVTSDQNQRDGQFQHRIMDTSTYPTSTFVLSQPIDLGALPAVGVQASYTAIGQLTLHGTTKQVAIPLKAQRTASGIQVSGALEVTFADWNINNPSGGPATTGETGTLEFLLNFTH